MLTKAFIFILIFSILIQIPVNSVNFKKNWNRIRWPNEIINGPKVHKTKTNNIKLLLLLFFLGFETSTEIYVRIPQEIVYGSRPNLLDKSVINKETENLLIIFPGAGGPDTYTEMLKNKIKESDAIVGVKRSICIYDWSKWRGNFLRAAFDSQQVGKIIGSQIGEIDAGLKYSALKNSNSDMKLFQKDDIRPFGLKNINVIGVSVGSFAADSFCKYYQSSFLMPKDSSIAPASIELTLLDPFTSRGIFGYEWGVRNFGESLKVKSSFLRKEEASSDVFNVYINTDDMVPSTNDPLSNAINYDVTQSISKNQFNPPPGDSTHSWPSIILQA